MRLALRSTDRRMTDLLSLLDDAWLIESRTPAGLATLDIAAPAVTGMLAIVSGRHTNAITSKAVEALLSLQHHLAAARDRLPVERRQRIDRVISRLRSTLNETASLLHQEVVLAGLEGADRRPGSWPELDPLLTRALVVAREDRVLIRVVAFPRLAEELRNAIAPRLESEGLDDEAITVMTVPRTASRMVRPDETIVDFTHCTAYRDDSGDDDSVDAPWSLTVQRADVTDGMVNGYLRMAEQRRTEFRAALAERTGGEIISMFCGTPMSGTSSSNRWTLGWTNGMRVEGAAPVPAAFRRTGRPAVQRLDSSPAEDR
jgi:hypothetical protein